MSQLFSSAQSATYKIQKWLGVNESPDGDTGLKKGEAARMVNWRITDGGAMRVRPGTENVAGLASEYATSVGGSEQEILREGWKTAFEADSYSSFTLDSVGKIVLTGDSKKISNGTWSSCVGRYFRYGGKVYQFRRMAYTEAQGNARIDGGAISWKTGQSSELGTNATYTDRYRAVAIGTGLTWKNGALELVNAITPTYMTSGIDTEPTYAKTADGKLYYCFLPWQENTSPYWQWGTDYTSAGYLITSGSVTADSWAWYAKEVSEAPNENTDTEVRSIWSGRVGTVEILAAACNGHLWRIENSDGAWSKSDLGEISTDGHVGLFGFNNKLYVMDGTEYYVYDGASLERVEGYVPHVITAAKPKGGGTDLEGRNKLTDQMWMDFSPDGTAKDFVLPIEASAVTKVTINGQATSQYYWVAEENLVRFSTAPDEGTANLAVYFRAKDWGKRSEVVEKTYSELYNGTTDARVFIYGDGTNETFYSGLDGNGQPSAEYFPDLNEAKVGDANTPITALVRHYSRLMVYKTDSTYSIYYGQVSDARGAALAGFYITPVNRSFGNEALGQAVLVENRPRTLDAHAIYEWKSLSSSSGNISSDSRNAQRVSGPVERTMRAFSTEKAICFFDKLEHEYYCVQDGVAVVQNTENGAWYVYDNFPAVSMILYKDELYMGTPDGWLRRISDELRSDNGKAINAEWESGSIDFGEDNIRKYSLNLWVGLKPEDDTAVTVHLETERETTEAQTVTAPSSRQKPTMQRIRMKISRFNYAKLFMSASSAGKTATVTAIDVSCKYTSIVR